MLSSPRFLPRCPSGCGVNTIAPNSPVGDALINTLTHEIFETVTDPGLCAWSDDLDGGEMMDKCGWIFGNTYMTLSVNPLTLGQPATYNIILGGKYYLVQQVRRNQMSRL